MKNRETRTITDTQNVISKYVSAQEGTDNVRIDSEIPDITSNSPSFNNMEFIKHYLNEDLIMLPNAILTHDNIPPTSIIKYEDFTL